MSSTVRRQEIDEIKNYNQNINRQALAKTYAQVALWELERPELSPITGEFSARTETNTENLINLLNERLNLVDRTLNRGSATEKDSRDFSKITDVIGEYNKLISPLLQSRFDSRIKSVAKSSLIRIKQPIVGLLIGFKNILKNLSFYGEENVKSYVEAFTVYDFINYQIDKEDYKNINLSDLKSRIPLALGQLPKEVQELYNVSQTRYNSKIPSSMSLTKEERAKRSEEFSGVSSTELNKFKQDLRIILPTGTDIGELSNDKLYMLKSVYDTALPKYTREEKTKEAYNRLVESGSLPTFTEREIRGEVAEESTPRRTQRERTPAPEFMPVSSPFGAREEEKFKRKLLNIIPKREFPQLRTTEDIDTAINPSQLAQLFEINQSLKGQPEGFKKESILNTLRTFM